MGRFRKFLAVSFRAKVLVPTIAIMVLLMAISMWLVNARVRRQLQNDAAQQLETADAVFKHMRDFREYYVFMRYRNVISESRFKALTALLAQVPDNNLSPDAQNTIRSVLNELIGDTENVADTIVFAAANGQRLSVARDPRLNIVELEASCASAIEGALGDQPKEEIVQNGEHLFDIVALPLRKSAADPIAGVIVFGVENSVAREFSQLTQSELVLLSDGHVIASSLRKPDLESHLSGQIDALKRGKPASNREEIAIGDEHYLCLGGWLDSPGTSHHIGYLILSSYEKPLQALRSTQQMILIISLLGITFGSVVVWFLVRKATQPLQELTHTAEAVGRGDFSRKVRVRYEDECGELARVFNQMIENLKNSREQLEMTVDTLKTTQAQLIQSEKLSGIGEFIAGVAHELNNPLTSVMGFSELLRQADLDPKHLHQLDMIHKSALRCQKIVQALLSFARRRTPERKPACVNSIIEAAVDILQYQLRTGNIEVALRLEPELPQAMVDAHQMQQVFVNILNNARQAIESHQPRGWIKVKTETRGTHVRITIQDSGPGISEANLSKIFDPFFTTKDIGQGTGLGLSLCYGIIKEHGGTIAPRSRPGEGATFVIELPITHEPGETVEEKPAPALESPNSSEGRGKRILVIDDEEPILNMVRDALMPRGYEVDVAPDGEAALRQLTGKHYDLALCDWKMPGLNGQQVYERLRAINPSLSERIIFITGDVINDKARKFLEQQNKICLPKPFTLVEFRAAIKKVLVPA